MLDKFQCSNKTVDLTNPNKYIKRTLMTLKIVILKRTIPFGIHEHKYTVFKVEKGTLNQVMTIRSREMQPNNLRHTIY